MKGKPVKFGMKLWVLASSDGYPFAFEVYTGKSDLAEEGLLGERVVRELTKVIGNKRQHRLYFNNFFSSPQLCRQQAALGLNCTGTVRTNRTQKCSVTPASDMKKKERGSFECYTDGHVNVCQWNDSKPVSIVTNFETVNPTSSVQIYSKSSKKGLLLPSQTCSNHITSTWVVWIY